MRFAGQVAMVTGAGRGIGAATAELLARQGATVAVLDLEEDVCRETAVAITEAGGQALPIPCDVTNRSQVEAAVQTIIERFGRLDLLVACAGITRDNLIHKLTDSDWDGVMETHLKGSFLSVQSAQRIMVAQRSGRIVLLSSTSALGNRGQGNYAAAKAGLQGFGKSMAIELGPFGIHVNVVAPGFIETRMTRATAERLGVDYELMKAHVASETPLRRVGTPEDVAKVIAFLCSDEASYVTGQVLYVAGGPKA